MSTWTSTVMYGQFTRMKFATVTATIIRRRSEHEHTGMERDEYVADLERLTADEQVSRKDNRTARAALPLCLLLRTRSRILLLPLHGQLLPQPLLLRRFPLPPLCLLLRTRSRI